MNKKNYFSLLALMAIGSSSSMEQPPKTVITALFKLRHEAEWPFFEQFQTKLHENKATMITDRFGARVDYYCKTNVSDKNVQLLTRWLELYTLDQILKSENPDRSFPNTLKESWYLKHGSEPFAYEGIVTKLCRSALIAEFNTLVDQAKNNIEHAINT